MLTLYNKRDVKWGGVEVGGIRISHMSHVDGDIKLSLAATRGKKEPIIIKRLDATDPLVAARAKLDTAARGGMESLKSAWGSLPGPQKVAIGGQDGCPAALKAIAAAVDAPKATEAPVAAQEHIDTGTGEVTTRAPAEDENPNM